MGGDADYDIVLSLWKRFVSADVLSVIIGISNPKNPMLAVLRSIIGHKIGDFSLGRNWAKIEPFWARKRA